MKSSSQLPLHTGVFLLEAMEFSVEKALRQQGTVGICTTRLNEGIPKGREQKAQS